MKIRALAHQVTSGTQTYPLFIGFMTAGELLQVAEVPNFKKTTPNQNIASNVLTPPVEQWQRPLIELKRDSIIETYSGTGEFMPNPVLVAERCIGGRPSIRIETEMAMGGIPTNIKIIDIEEPKKGESAALWIIDGQHRITGLGDPRCKQRDNPIPVVLLLNNGGSFYNGRNLAKIFAQVTTEATPLEPLHKEWLTFAFQLDSYLADRDRQAAMECTAKLCNLPVNKLTGNPNCFHDDIRFNDELAPKPKFLGHQYDCRDFADLVYKYYYSEAKNFKELSPSDLADQIATAFEVLRASVAAPHHKTVFFGSGRYAHKIMCDAYIVGLLTYLRVNMRNPSRQDWVALLERLNFDKTDWNFQQHVAGSGTVRWVEKSKTLAIEVFASVFAEDCLPDSVTNLWDYLSGDQLFVELEFKYLSKKGRPIKANSDRVTYGRAAKKTQPMNGRKYFRVRSTSVNGKHITIVDEKSSPADPVTFKKSGNYLRPPKVDPNNQSQNPLTLTIKCTLYGGNEERLTSSRPETPVFAAT